jgi:hypothetical protein
MTEKHEIHKMDLQTTRIGGDAAGAASVCPFDSIDTISFSNMIKREYFTPWTMGLWK